MSSVEVDEARLLNTASGAAAWWNAYRANADLVGRIRVITATPSGDRVQVVCNDANHAALLAAQMTRVGVPQAALRVGESK